MDVAIARHKRNSWFAACGFAAAVAVVAVFAIPAAVDATTLEQGWQRVGDAVTLPAAPTQVPASVPSLMPAAPDTASSTSVVVTTGETVKTAKTGPATKTEHASTPPAAPPATKNTTATVKKDTTATVNKPTTPVVKTPAPPKQKPKTPAKKVEKLAPPAAKTVTPKGKGPKVKAPANYTGHGFTNGNAGKKKPHTPNR